MISSLSSMNRAMLIHKLMPTLFAPVTQAAARPPSVDKLANSVRKIDQPVDSTIQWLASNHEGLITGAAVATGIVGLMLILRYFGQRILASNPESHSWKGVIGSVLAKTSIFFMVAAAVDMVVSYTEIPSRLGHLINIVFVIAASIQGAIWARELILGIIKSRVRDDPGASNIGNAIGVIRVLVSVAVFSIAFIVILDNLGVNVTALVAGFGIGGIAIGLAAQGIFADLFASLSILFDRPFRRGQQISWGGKGADGSPNNTGTVERIGMKSTRIRSRTGEMIIVGNTQLLQQDLTNIDEAMAYRFWLPMGVTYQTDPDKLEQMSDLIQEVIAPIKGVKLVRCAVKGFGPSSIDFDLVYDDRGRDFDTRAHNRSTICIGITRLFAREKIEFAYPTQTTFTAAPDGTMVMPYASVQPVAQVDPPKKK